MHLFPSRFQWRVSLRINSLPFHRNRLLIAPDRPHQHLSHGRRCTRNHPQPHLSIPRPRQSVPALLLRHLTSRRRFSASLTLCNPAGPLIRPMWLSNQPTVRHLNRLLRHPIRPVPIRLRIRTPHKESSRHKPSRHPRSRSPHPIPRCQCIRSQIIRDPRQQFSLKPSAVRHCGGPKTKQRQRCDPARPLWHRNCPASVSSLTVRRPS